MEAQQEPQASQEAPPSSASSVSGHSGASSSSNPIKCRFCPMTYPDELQAQLHYISEHPAELLEQARNIMNASAAPTESEEGDPVMQATTQVAMQMAKANQVWAGGEFKKLR